MRGRLFFTQGTDVLDLKAKSLLVWIMSNNLLLMIQTNNGSFSRANDSVRKVHLSSWASIKVSSLLARGRGLTASETNIPRTEIYCQA